MDYIKLQIYIHIYLEIKTLIPILIRYTNPLINTVIIEIWKILR